MACGGWPGDGCNASNGRATTAIHQEGPGFTCRHGDRRGCLDGLIWSAIRNTDAAALARRLSTLDGGSSVLSRSARINIVLGHERMEKAGKHPCFTVFWRDQLWALFVPLVILRWIRCHCIQALAKRKSDWGKNGTSAAAVYLRRRTGFDISLPVEKIFRRTFSTAKKPVEHDLRFNCAALHACWTR